MSVEALIVQLLNASPLVEPEAFTDVPARRPPEFITVERTGGGLSQVTQSPIIAVQVWGRSRYLANSAAEHLARSLKPILITHASIARVNVNSVYNFPDPSGIPRAQIVVELVTTT